MTKLSHTGRQALARMRAIDYRMNRNIKTLSEHELDKLLKERAEKETIYKKELRREYQPVI
jgi:hypothetical protein